MIDRNKIIKFISGFLIVSILLPSVLLSVPQKVSAIWGIMDVVATNVAGDVLSGTTSVATTASAATQVSVLGFKIKEWAVYIGQQLLKQIAKRLLAKMTQATINWINSDFHGSPLFLENPESFFKDIAKSEIRTLVDLFGYDSNRFPFGKQFALNTIDSYKRQLAENSQYTLSKVINDPDLLARYRNDFNVGGWNGFLINTQYPQNNYLGFQMTATEELARRLEGTVQNAAQRVQTTLQQGMGFLSPQTCPDNPKYNNGVNEFQRPSYKALPYNVPDPIYDYSTDPATVTNQAGLEQATAKWQADDTKARAQWAETNTCPGGLVSTTPGSVAANQVFGALNVPFLTTALDGALGNSLAAIFDALINKLIDTGLNGLSSTISGSSSSGDNWSYNGQTLPGTTTGNTNANGDLSIPDNVSVSVGKSTSTNIYGGTGIYSIKTPSDATKAVATIDLSSSSGPKLKVAGVGAGITPVVIQDSSVPVKTATVLITVSAAGALVVSPANIVSIFNDLVIVAISGGQGDYSIKTKPEETIAIAIISGDNLIVTGTGKGGTSIVIQDSSKPAKTAIINITINAPDDLVIKPSNISVKIGEVTTIPILGGTVRYTVTSQQDITVATAEILTSNMPTGTAAAGEIKITGIAPGTSLVGIKDSSVPVKNATIIITTLAPLGMCNKRFSDDFRINQEMTKEQCDAIEGSWKANVTP